MLFFQRAQRLLRLVNHSHYKRCGCSTDTTRIGNLKNKVQRGPGLKEFIIGSSSPVSIDPPDIPYLPSSVPVARKQKVFFDVYGCQMNLNDTEIVWSILKNEGFEKTEVEDEADIFLVMTCAIREGAESKIWHRLDHLRGFKRRRALSKLKDRQLKIGILGCMAERLKEKLIEKEKSVDIVAGPDSYRDLPRLLAVTESGQTAVNVLLSLDETYADVVPVRLNQDNVTAFISIMRGCDNMCTYCIVPFTRGRERSRPAASIVDEVRHLADQGVKEVTLLGQNVNSYRDTTATANFTATATTTEPATATETRLARGFRTVYRSKAGGLRFAELLARVADVDPEMRIRFTAAHPKDFPDEVLQVVSERANVCKLLHLPAQSGSSAVLQRMRRGYSSDAYLELVRHARAAIPGVGLSTDMICGFCGETDAEFEETLALMRAVDYHVAFLFPYSMREKTTAHRRFKDDVPEQVKKHRHGLMVDLYRRKCQALNEAEIGTTHLVLVEGTARRTGQILGRNELYLKVLFDQTDLPTEDGGRRQAKPGDYVAVKIVGAKSSVLSGVPMFHSSVREFYRERSWGDRAVKL